MGGIGGKVLGTGVVVVVVVVVVLVVVGAAVDGA